MPLLASFDNMIKLEAALALAPDPVRRLGALGVRVIEDAERLRERLRLANAEYERLVSMGEGWWRIVAGMSEQAARVLLYRLGPEQLSRPRAARLGHADHRAWPTPSWRALATLPERWSVRRCSVEGGRLHRARCRERPAPRRGAAGAEEAWIAAGLSARSRRVGADRR